MGRHVGLPLQSTLNFSTVSKLSTLNYLDIIIAIVLFLFGYKGFRKGLIIEVVTLLAFAVGIYGAMRFSDFTAEHLQEFVEVDCHVA